MQTVLAFVFVVAVLIVIYELGHYSVARLCGVKTLRFSISFGKVLFRRVGRGPDHTKWMICVIPLGGYIKVLGEGSRDPEKDPSILPEDLPHTFGHQPVYKRFAIVAADPVTNFLLAIALCAVLVQVGAIEPLPILGIPPPGGIAAQADLRARDRVTAIGVDGGAPVSVRSWSNVHMHLYSVGITGHDALVQVRGTDDTERTVRLHGLPNAAHTSRADMIDQIGLRLFGGPVAIADMLPLSVAARAGSRVGDQIIRFAGQSADQAMDLVRQIRVMPEQNTSIDILRNDQPITLPARPDAGTDPKNPASPRIGKLGAQPDQKVETATTRDEPVVALSHAVGEVWRTSVLSLQVSGKMVVGRASLQNLNGPITVADFADETASLGQQTFVSFPALISVNLGVLNLLSIPTLDGGYLLYYRVEFLTGRPTPGSWQVVFQKIGAAYILFLTSLALYNDLSRLFLARGQIVFKLGH